MSEAYKNAGVDIHAGYEAVTRMKKHVARTKIAGVMGGLGGFGGLFDLSGYNVAEPVLVSGTDGVGTKLMLAFAMGKHDTIGIDAVAMCVNDIITVGAQPLFFLDYIACGKLDPAQVEAIVAGVSEGCVQSGCALIGGETAEMPAMYTQGEYDIAGFCVGVVDKPKMLTGAHIRAGDTLLGVASSGVHSNGFSLIRKVIEDKGLDLQAVYAGMDKPLGEELLTPTRIYAKAVRALCDAGLAKGMAHITGGGFIENIPRILPAGLGANIVRGSWDMPAVFPFLQAQGGVDADEMYNLFNMGIGLVVAVAPEDAPAAIMNLQASGEKVYAIGIVNECEGVTLA